MQARAQGRSVVWGTLADPIGHRLDLAGHDGPEFRHLRAEADIDVGHLVENVARSGITRQDSFATVIALRGRHIDERRV